MASVDDIVWSTDLLTSQDVSMHDSSILSIDSMNIDMFFSDTVANTTDITESVAESEGVEEIEDSEEIDRFLSRIRESGVFCPIMALRDPFSKHFIQKTANELIEELTTDEDVNPLSIMHLLSSLHNPFYESLTLEDLREIASGIQLVYTDDEIDFIESKTRDQSSCKLWFQLRIGRVTGSTFAKVCRTQILTPSMTIIKQICYPEQNIFKNQATTYGTNNESAARDCYFQARRQEHRNFTIRQTGLRINNSYPFCGASPDAMVSCDCCGSGTVEIKCPWTLRNGNLDAYLKKRLCPLDVVDDDEGGWTFKLKEKHEYYYQVQMQMFLTNSEYSDFVVWQPPTEARNPIITIRVFKDEIFWFEEYAKASVFLQKVLMPELLGCYYTQSKKG